MVYFSLLSCIIVVIIENKLIISNTNMDMVTWVGVCNVLSRIILSKYIDTIKIKEKKCINK